MSPDAKTEALRLACHAYLRRAVPPGAPVKHLADILGQSRQTAARLLAGEAPTSAQLAALAQHFGREFVAVVFEPVVGEMTEAATASTLLRVERLLLSLQAAGEGLPSRPEAGSPAPQRSISRRLPLAEISRYPALMPALERIRARSGRLELSEALALARADSSGGTSVNRQSPGDVLRFVYRARASRLHAPGETIRDLPVRAMADAAYGELAVACFEESRQAAEPVLARVSGPVHRSDGVTIFTDIVVLRSVDRARDGTLIYSSTFVRG